MCQPPPPHPKEVAWMQAAATAHTGKAERASLLGPHPCSLCPEQPGPLLLPGRRPLDLFPPMVTLAFLSVSEVCPHIACPGLKLICQTEDDSELLTPLPPPHPKPAGHRGVHSLPYLYSAESGTPGLCLLCKHCAKGTTSPAGEQELDP